MMSIRLASATDVNAARDLHRLHRRLAEFYTGPEMRKYFQLAHALNEDWDRKRHHRQIKKLCTAGMRVVDMGCGSAHAYDNLRAAGISYVGVDWSGEQVECNRSRVGREATFITASLYDTGLDAAQFDLVLSSFTLEHLVYPHLFLREAVRLARVGGLIIILCPNFRPLGRIPSLYFGGSVAPLKRKILSGRARDSLHHLYLRNVYYPHVIKHSYPRARYPFLVNLEPSCLRGAYYPDNDAVYFTDEQEIMAELARLGAICEPGRRRHGRDTCFIVVRKGELGRRPKLSGIGGHSRAD